VAGICLPIFPVYTYFIFIILTQCCYTSVDGIYLMLHKIIVFTLFSFFRIKTQELTSIIIILLNIVSNLMLNYYISIFLPEKKAREISIDRSCDIGKILEQY